MAEVRPARGEYVSVVELRTARELEILDLVREPEWPNPFTDDAVNYWVEFAELLEPSGTNGVLFDPSAVHIGTWRLVEIVETTVKYQDPWDRWSKNAR